MSSVERVLEVRASLTQAWERLSDYEAACCWDPRVARATRTSADKGLGTLYSTVSRVVDGEVVAMKVIQWRSHEIVQLAGVHPRLRTLETLRFEASRGGTCVHWISEWFPHGDERLDPWSARHRRDALGEEVSARLKAFVDGPLERELPATHQRPVRARTVARR